MNKFFETSLLAIILIIVCALIQILFGITWWAVILVSLFLIGITALKSNYKYRSAGKLLFWIVITTWIFYVVKVEILQQKFPFTNFIKDRSQESVDYEFANWINPRMLKTKEALLRNMNNKQDSLGKLINRAVGANQYERADSLMIEQVRITNLMVKIGEMADEVQNKVDSVNLNLPQSKARLFQLKKGERKALLSFPDRSRIYYESSGNFAVVHRNTYQYSKSNEDLIGKSAGVSFHDFIWAGSAVVVAEEDITIKAWF